MAKPVGVRTLPAVAGVLRTLACRSVRGVSAWAEDGFFPIARSLDRIGIIAVEVVFQALVHGDV